MEQRDYIMKEIEKISVLILGMLGKLKSITKSKQFEQEREALFAEFEDASGVSIDDILAIETERVSELLNGKTGFNSSNIESLSELLYEFSIYLDDQEGKICLEKAIFLLEWIAREQKTFDLERERKLSEYRDAQLRLE